MSDDEDFFLPAGVVVNCDPKTTVEDIEYFRKKLWEALQVPTELLLPQKPEGITPVPLDPTREGIKTRYAGKVVNSDSISYNSPYNRLQISYVWTPYVPLQVTPSVYEWTDVRAKGMPMRTLAMMETEAKYHGFESWAAMKVATGIGEG